jgi:glycosyltransferase involved in cell wall biosynthesis
MTPISVCCLTFNSERTIRKTLESVKEIADEIIVVDSFSTDRTIEIVKEFTDKIYIKEYKYHGLQMNYAIGLCTHDWVFCIDSDEFLDEGMVRHICRLKEEGLDGK